MPTETNKKQQINGKSGLTPRQLKAIPLFVASHTYTEGIKKAKINRTTFYEWLKIPEFKAELDQQRDEITAQAFGVLSQALTKAVENLVGLIDNKDERLKRLACKDIIEYILEHRENEDLDKRLTEVEKLLAERPR